MSNGKNASRIERLRRRMREAGIDVLLSFKPENSFYLTGFNPIIYSHPVIAILPLEGEPSMLVHALRDDHARASTFVKDIRLYGAWSTKVTMGPSWLEALRRMLDEGGLAAGVAVWSRTSSRCPVSASCRNCCRALASATCRIS